MKNVDDFHVGSNENEGVLLHVDVALTNMENILHASWLHRRFQDGSTWDSECDDVD